MTRSLRRLAGVSLVVALMLPVTVVDVGAQSGPVDEYVDVIVVLESGIRSANASAVANQASRYDAQVRHIYLRVLNGYAARIPASRVAALEADPSVAFVEPDLEVTVAAQDVPVGIDRVYATSNPDSDIDGIDDVRVDVDVAVLDTGVDDDHPDLNVVSHINCLSATTAAGCSSSDTDDGNSHGTHVAGTIGALDNDIGVVGVAPGARIWNVKVLNDQGSGSISGVIAGLDWVVERADDVEVANMSLTAGGFSTSFDTAVSAAVDAGVVVVVAAGNDNSDAANYSPAAFDDAITVSAMADFDGLPGGLASNQCSDVDDTGSNFSNWGDVVDITAPGSCVRSTLPDGLYGSKSGTSMASPHVAGAVALLAAGANDPEDRSDVEAIRATLLANGNFDWDDDSGDDLKEPLLDVRVRGLLRVVTSPAVESQITVDGVPRDSWGLDWVKMAPGSYEVCFSDVTGWTAPDCEIAVVTSGDTTLVTGSFEQRGYLRGVTSPAVPATMTVDGLPRDDWGFWTDVAPGSYEVCFGAVEGYDPPECQTVNVTAGELTVATGDYVTGTGTASPDPHGLLRVVTSPAVESQITVDGVPQDSWGLDWVKMAPGSYEVCFSDVTGWTAPECESVDVVDGETTVLTGVFEQRGYLRGVTSPAVPATLFVDGVPRDDWGFWTDMTPGSYEVCFGPVDGFDAPGCETVDVVAGGLTVVTGEYAAAP